MVNRMSGLTMKLSCFAALLGAALLFSSPAPAATSSNASSPLGIDLARLAYYDSEEPFLNIFKTTAITQSTPDGWRTMDGSKSETNEEAYLQLDSNGYPTTLTATSADPNSPQKFTQVCTYLLNLPASNAGSGPPYRAGQYVILYDGAGTITVDLDGQMVSTSQTATGGRDVFNVAAPRVGVGVRLCIVNTDAANHLRNIRVVRAANEALLNQGYIFSPTFINLLKNFRAIRAMEWLGMDDFPSPTGNWTDRTQLSAAGWASNNGAPLEVVIDLCNAVSADCWINVPDTADNNYITQMATLVHQELGPTQKVYVEFSNEVWNPGYLQFGYAEKQGGAMWPSNTNQFQDNRDWYGMRVAQMCDIWASVWGTDFARVHCVLAAQAANTWTATEALNCPLWSGAPCSKHHITDVAIAPYFGWSPNQTPTAWNSMSQATVVNDIFSELNSGGGFLSLTSSLTGLQEGPIQNVSDWEAAYQKALAPFGLPLITYEGGQTLIGNPTYNNGSTIVSAFIAANSDQRMATAYTTALNNWKSNNGHVYMIYNDIGGPSQYGEWGLLDSWLDTVAPLSAAPPKWQAVQNFIANNPCWWANCTGKVAAVPMAPQSFKTSN
jgi:hypothetical protein